MNTCSKTLIFTCDCGAVFPQKYFNVHQGRGHGNIRAYPINFYEPNDTPETLHNRFLQFLQITEARHGRISPNSVIEDFHVFDVVIDIRGKTYKTYPEWRSSSQ